MKPTTLTIALFIACIAPLTRAAPLAPAPLPPAAWAPWSMPWGDDVPGVMSAASLVPAPAGKDGPIVARDGHFYSGNNRVRFLGANLAFGANVPTHEQADRLANRLAHFGFNAVRLHHMDMQPFPNGITADPAGERLSSDGLDRLDYFIAALKRAGVYSDLNLHVSRAWSKSHGWPNADRLPEFDKMLDVFNADLLKANQQYARDLLTHVNAYTKLRYADDPAICIVEINNEDTLFLWGGEQKLAELPEPYAGQLKSLWNKWLAARYPTREKLKEAWSVGAQPAGPNQLKDPGFTKVGAGNAWYIEQHDGAKMTAALDLNEDAPAHPPLVVKVSAVDGTVWHLQLNQAGIPLKKGRYYTARFDAAASEPLDVTVGTQQAHEPWQPLGLSQTVTLGTDWKTFRAGFVASADDDNARLSFLLGRKVATIRLSNVELTEGGQLSLATQEDPTKGTVDVGGPRQGGTEARSNDWYDFLQQTDQAYFVAMRRFLKEDVGVKCPITGSIGLGPLGTRSQAEMDFVDAHAYWDHPRFPHRSWDSRDWLIDNKPMVDDPAHAALWGLTATRVAGKPFTVTEYNHAAPNEWQAEAMPFIAAYAALQDWDGVFLFAYAHGGNFDRMDHTDSYFNVEGNPLKMDLTPIASRLFVGAALKPLSVERVIAPTRVQMLSTGSTYFYQQWPFLRDLMGVTWQDALHERIALSFGDYSPQSVATPAQADKRRVEWTGGGEGTHTGRFIVRDPAAAVFVGFTSGATMPIDLGAARIERLDAPFATVMLTAADAGTPIASADRLLLTVAARESNKGMQWDAGRHTVADQWGSTPPLIEVVGGRISIASTKALTGYALNPDGRRGEKLPTRFENGRTVVELGTAKTLWYEMVRE